MMITKRIIDEKVDQTEGQILHSIGYSMDCVRHQALFEKARDYSRQGLKIAVLTFPESPKAGLCHIFELMLHRSPEDRDGAGRFEVLTIFT